MDRILLQPGPAVRPLDHAGRRADPPERVTDDVLVETLIGWRPGTSELAYTTGHTSRTIWAHALADGKEWQLTPDTAQAGWFNLSSRGEVMVNFVRGGGVNDFAVLPIGGGEPQVILANAGGTQARWSPDGSMLVFQSDRGGSEDIWVMDAIGGAPRQLTSWPGSETAPRWNADGTEIYFRADREALFGDVWRVPATGGDPVRITTTGNVNVFLSVNRMSQVFVGQVGGGKGTFITALVLARWLTADLLGPLGRRCGRHVASDRFRRYERCSTGNAPRTTAPPAQWW